MERVRLRWMHWRPCYWIILGILVVVTSGGFSYAGGTVAMNLASITISKSFVTGVTLTADSSNNLAWGIGLRQESNGLLRSMPALDTSRSVSLGTRRQLVQAETWLDVVVLLLPNSGEAWVRSGQIALLIGRYDVAIRALRRATDLLPDRRIAQIKLGDAYTLRGDVLAGTEAYEKANFLGRERQAALNYLGMAEIYLISGNDSTARPLLEKAIQAWPASLFASYHLARITGDPAWNKRLYYFDINSLDLLDKYSIEAIIELARSGVWEPDLLYRVVNYVLVHADGGPANTLVSRLLDVYPEDSHLWFYLAENYHRQGQWAQAQSAYRHVLDLSPDFSPAYFRMGQIEEQSGGSRAVNWYQSYSVRAPRDLGGLRKLVELEPQSENVESWKKELIARADDRSIVARLLDIEVRQVQLGENLIENGDFEIWDQKNRNPARWAMVNQVSGGLWYPATFAHSADSLTVYSGSLASRVDGLWVQHDPARAGYLYWNETSGTGQQIDLEPGAAYVLSFFYRTDSQAETARISTEDVMNAFGKPVADGFCVKGCTLPGTAGEWHHMVILDWNRSEQVSIIGLALFNYEPGIVWFDQVSLRRVESSYRGDRLTKVYSDE